MMELLPKKDMIFTIHSTELVEWRLKVSGPVGALALSQGNKLLLTSVCVSLDIGETEKLRQLRRFFYTRQSSPSFLPGSVV